MHVTPFKIAKIMNLMLSLFCHKFFKQEWWNEKGEKEGGEEGRKQELVMFE